MPIFETEYEKKSFVITSVITIILLFLFFVLGLTYLDPPPENGIAVNFGNTEFGSGNENTYETVKTSPQPTQSATATKTEEDEVLSQEIEDALVIKDNKNNKPTKQTNDVVKPKPAENPKPSKNTSDALSSLLNGPKNDGKANDGDGTSNQAGNQGKIDGSIYANSYYGSGAGNGAGNGSSWGLNGRRLAGNSIVKQECNESGRVVIEIAVNRQGRVVNAKRTKGTQNSAQCLVEAAIATAKTFRWQPDPNAPEIQIGFIEINFRLGE